MDRRTRWNLVHFLSNYHNLGKAPIPSTANLWKKYQKLPKGTRIYGQVQCNVWNPTPALALKLWITRGKLWINRTNWGELHVWHKNPCRLIPPDMGGMRDCFPHTKYAEFCPKKISFYPLLSTSSPWIKLSIDRGICSLHMVKKNNCPLQIGSFR